MEAALEPIAEFVQNHGALTIILEVAILLVIRNVIVNIPRKVRRCGIGFTTGCGLWESAKHPRRTDSPNSAPSAAPVGWHGRSLAP